MTLEQDYFHFNGTQFSFLKNREQQGRPCLFLHGWLDNAASFIPLFRHLDFARPCHIFEFAGHGLSSHRSFDAHYHFADWVYDVIGFIRSQYDQPVDLVGHSLGGIVASVVAAVRPELVNKLVMLDAAGPFTDGCDNALTNFKKAMASRESVAKPSSKEVFDSLDNLIKIRARISGITPDLAELLLKRNLQKNECGQWVWRSDRRLRTLSPIRFSDGQAKSVVEGIEAETLVLLGDNGYQKIREMFQARRYDWKNVTMNTVVGNHHFHMIAPAETAKAIQEWL